MARYTLADVAPDQPAAPTRPRYTLADVAPGQTAIPPSGQVDQTPTPSMSPSAQYSEPKGRMATMDQVEKSLPMAGAIGLGAASLAFPPVAGAIPAILTGAGLAGAGALAGKSAEGLVHAARTGEASETPLTDSLKEGAKYGVSDALLGGLFKALEVGSPAVKKIIEDKYPAIAQAFTGVNKRYFSNVKGVEDILPSFAGGPKSLYAAGDAVDSAEASAFGDAAKPTVREVNDPALGTARKNSIKAAEDLKSIRGIAQDDPALAAEIMKDPETGATLLKGKRGTARQLEAPGIGGSTRHALEDQKNELSQALGENYPEVASALKDYGKSMTRDQVTKFLPVLKNGDPSVMRMFMALLGNDAGVAPGLSVPAVHAVTKALAGTTLTALGKLAGVPVLKSLVAAEIARRSGGEQDAQ